MDLHEEAERLAHLADAWGDINLAAGREGQSDDMAKISDTLRALSARLAEVERERDEARAQVAPRGAEKEK